MSARDTLPLEVAPGGLFLTRFEWGLFKGRAYSRVLIQLFDIYLTKSSLSELLFSILLQEQSKIKY